MGGRDRFEIVTKCGICRPGPVIPEFRIRYFDLSPEHIRWSVDRSLSEMGIDVIDVLILHRADHLMEPDGDGGGARRHRQRRARCATSASPTSCRRASTCCSRT